MKISCDCGYCIPDHGDALPDKAHLLPDQSFEEYFEQLDAALERVAKTPARLPMELMEVRKLFLRSTRRVWRCHRCGKLYFDDPIPGGKLPCYQPVEFCMPVLAR